MQDPSSDDGEVSFDSSSSEASECVEMKDWDTENLKEENASFAKCTEKQIKYFVLCGQN